MTVKVWGGTMMGRTGRQVRVIMKGTIKEFRAATGIGRDYMAKTGNGYELIVADEYPPGTLLVEKTVVTFVPMKETG